MTAFKLSRLGTLATIFSVVAATAAEAEDWQFYAGNNAVKSEVDMASVAQHDTLTYFTYRYKAIDEKFARLNKTTQAVVDCKNNLRSDISPDSSYTLRSIYPETYQAAQFNLVCHKQNKLENTFVKTK
jgi:hypothetical protein